MMLEGIYVSLIWKDIQICLSYDRVLKKNNIFDAKALEDVMAYTFINKWWLYEWTGMNEKR